MGIGQKIDANALSLLHDFEILKGVLLIVTLTCS
jgi:hypothetical protein